MFSLFLFPFAQFILLLCSRTLWDMVFGFLSLRSGLVLASPAPVMFLGFAAFMLFDTLVSTLSSVDSSYILVLFIGVSPFAFLCYPDA